MLQVLMLHFAVINGIVIQP